MASDPGRVVMNAALITLTSTTAASVLPESYGGKGEVPSFRLLFGTALTFAGLSMMAEPLPGLVVPLAITIATTAFIYYGIPILDKFATKS